MSKHTFLVVIDDSPEFLLALRYACQRARRVSGGVALLSVIEPQGIETWGGVERALDDEAFSYARELVAHHEKMISEATGQKPRCYYKKGELRSVLIDLIDHEKDISTLVLAAQSGESARNPLIQYLTSEKGLRKLKIPLIVVPENCRCLEQEV